MAPRSSRSSSDAVSNAKKYTQSNAWIRLTSLRKTGATTKSVFSCENRFSIIGCCL